MKVAIIGYSGSGKSTLAKALSDHYQLPLLYLDTLQFEANWKVRPQDDFRQDLEKFMTEHNSWVIDGNYSFAHYIIRLEEADQIIFMNFSRWNCLFRAFKRYRKYKGRTRASMAPDCTENFDWEFIRWILWDGRRKKQKDRYQWIQDHYPEKIVVLHNQRELDRYLESLKG